MKIAMLLLLVNLKLYSSFQYRRIPRTSFLLKCNSNAYNSDVDKEEGTQSIPDDIIEENLSEAPSEGETGEAEVSEETIDPQIEAIEKYEKVLKQQVELLENTLRSERFSASKAKDKLSESGKAGYFMVQAQVNDFLRKSDAAQKDRVQSNKREFVMKMLPIIDSFRDSPISIPANTETGQNMHKGFGALLTGILSVIDKYGFKEFVPDVGEVLDPIRHTVQSVVTIEGAVDGTVSEVIRSGYFDIDGTVLRRAIVVGTKAAGAAGEVDAEVDGVETLQ